MTQFGVVRRAIALAAARMIAMPSALVVTGVFQLMVVAIVSGVWRVAAEVNGGDIATYSGAALVWYIATSESATISLPQRLIETIGTDIANGSIVSEWLRPASSFVVRLATEVGQMLPRLAVCVVVGGIFSVVTVGAPIHVGALALAAPSLLIALVLNLVAQHAFAAASFWIRDAKGAWFLYQKLVFVAGGMLLPLEVLPGSVQTVAKLSPFASMAYAPARLAAGFVEPQLLLIQLFWLVVLLALTARLFVAGERRFIAVGA